MGDWTVKAISSFGRVVTGKTPPKANPEYFDGNELFVSPKDLDWDSTYIEQTTTNISNKALDKFKNQVLPRNAVMFTSLSFAFGKVGIAQKRCMTNQQINSVIVDDDNDFRFVYYLLRASKPFIFSFNSGIDTPIVPKSVFEKIELPCPKSREHQRKVAAVLSPYDELIRNTRRRIELLERIALQTFKEWFVRFRFPKHAKATFTKGIPAGWTQTTLGSICEFTMGQSPKSEFYNEIGDGLPFNQGVGTYGRRFPSREVFCSVDGRRAKEGDILFSVRAPVGRLNIADCDMIIGRGLAAMRHKTGFNSYLFYLLRNAFSEEDIIGNGAIFNSVGKGELSKFVLLAPAPELVEQFDDFAKPIDRQIAALVVSIDKLKKDRDGLMARILSNKLDVAATDIVFPSSMLSDDLTVETEELVHA